MPLGTVQRRWMLKTIRKNGAVLETVFQRPDSRLIDSLVARQLRYPARPFESRAKDRLFTDSGELLSAMFGNAPQGWWRTEPRCHGAVPVVVERRRSVTPDLSAERKSSYPRAERVRGESLIDSVARLLPRYPPWNEISGFEGCVSFQSKSPCVSFPPRSLESSLRAAKILDRLTSPRVSGAFTRKFPRDRPLIGANVERFSL